MSDSVWEAFVADSALIATAIHNGHDLRPEVEDLMILDEPDRLREEDPYTAAWTEVAPTRIVARRSRFGVDLNRPRERAFYRKPEDAWGLHLWRSEPGAEIVDDSLAEYDAFYSEVDRIFRSAEQRHGHFVVFDIHTYNHRRDGPDLAAADPKDNPEVNVGTGTMMREYWAPVVDRFIADLRAFDFGGRSLDVRENVKFQGGHLSRWTHENFPKTGCVLAIEFKKFFMDEWTGTVDAEEHQRIFEALESTVSGVLEQAKKVFEDSDVV